jgi:ribosomal protein S12 methylthiotransferase accessory factor
VQAAALTDTRLHWARGWSLLDGAPAFVPAQLVYLRRPPAAEPAIAYATSNGVACGPTLAEALLAALCELVERDAFMLAWLNRLTLPRLAWSYHRKLVQLERRYFAPTGLRYSAIDLSTFSGLPAVLGVVRPSGARLGGLGIGAGCAGSVEEAWGKALAEAFSVYRWVGERAAHGVIPDSPNDVRTFDDHLLFYAPPERAAETNFLDASDALRDVGEIAPLAGEDPGSQLDAAISLLRRRGIAAYAVDVTAPDIREAGLWVVRVLAPQLCSLDVAHSARFLGGTRIYAAAYEAGLRERPLDFDELNPNPHPFP